MNMDLGTNNLITKAVVHPITHVTNNIVIMLSTYGSYAGLLSPYFAALTVFIGFIAGVYGLFVLRKKSKLIDKLLAEKNPNIAIDAKAIDE